MAHKITTQELVEQNFKASLVIASSSEDRKKLEIVISAETAYSPKFVITKNGEVISEYLLIKTAIEHYNSI